MKRKTQKGAENEPAPCNEGEHELIESKVDSANLYRKRLYDLQV